MSGIARRAPSWTGAGVTAWRARAACLVIAALAGLPSASAADLAVTPVFFATQIGAERLAGGAGGDFESPAVDDVALAILSVSNTAGASWEMQIEIEDAVALQLDGVSLAIRRSGGSGEAGIIGGLGYRTVTGSPQAFFSGSGDYASIEIRVRIAGISVSRPPASYTPRLRYTVVTP